MCECEGKFKKRCKRLEENEIKLQQMLLAAYSAFSKFVNSNALEDIRDYLNPHGAINKEELDDMLLAAHYELNKFKGSQEANKDVLEDIMIYLEDEGLIDIAPHPACGE